jgi:hypothetical protein
MTLSMGSNDDEIDENFSFVFLIGYHAKFNIILFILFLVLSEKCEIEEPFFRV